MFPLAHKFLHNRLLEGYTERNIICIYSYSVPLLATVDLRSEAERHFYIIFQISYFYYGLKKNLRKKGIQFGLKTIFHPIYKINI